MSDTLQLIGACCHYKTVTSGIQNCSHVLKRSSLCEGGTFSAFTFAGLLSLGVRVVHTCAPLLRSVIALHTVKQNHDVDFSLWATKKMFLQCNTFIMLIYIDRSFLTYHLCSDVCFNECHYVITGAWCIDPDKGETCYSLRELI